MVFNIIKFCFVIVSMLLASFMAVRTFFPNIFKDSNKLSPLMAFLGGLFIFYVLLGFVLIFLYPIWYAKAAMLLFAASPFVIGKLVTYEKLKTYSIIQVLCVILSLVFVMTV